MIDVIFPVLDEAAALPWVLDRLPSGFRAIVVDNGSTDGSAGIAAAHGALVVDELRRGFGAACWAGLGAASSAVVAFCDGDASTDPGHLHAVTDPVADGSFDLMLGARQPTERGSWPRHARLANRYLARRINRVAGTHLSDNGPLRAVNRRALLDVGMVDRRFGWPLEMVLRGAGAGWSIGEVPVPYLPRAGRSKVTGTVSGTLRAVRDMQSVLRALAVDDDGAAAHRRSVRQDRAER